MLSIYYFIGCVLTFRVLYKILEEEYVEGKWWRMEKTSPLKLAKLPRPGQQCPKCKNIGALRIKSQINQEYFCKFCDQTFYWGK